MIDTTLPVPIFWIDLETTGLDPEDDDILEIAIMLAPDSRKPFEAELVHHSVHPIEKLLDKVHTDVIEMHAKSGLLRECRSLSVKRYGPNGSRSEAWRDLDGLLLGKIADDRPKPYLGGSCVHFDRRFLQNFAPGFVRHFSHRHYDVSTLKIMMESFGMPRFEKGETHRAKEDLLETLAHGKACFEWLHGQARDPNSIFYRSWFPPESVTQDA